ncbi:uncharacterized protein MONOS_12772 [Monocercomonoides exilis]|uniref:uncharacterized protein n=1 Tax=Monocercomonoides exilis TaxID=2049356 RepID=UPI003559D302|nr:hypothetical protein MONOS_12772 [Monocercomonoides exilis]|eukprot:MONOS_12772.1-p1 / transcript=MONOS_12772.1 / gene=MONOS_12772 / organism=Monocercomonoides_exilis_PA203 / gene_product=unspecified product / transcript_product=unspecified product / location=Mono_scaffold00731:25830-27023(-) / protein_length=340 / sequence_SO=supercontig / SO=protein_coding / is_pseudo=false
MTTRSTKTHLPKDPQAPKRPSPSFLLFVQQKKDEIYQDILQEKRRNMEEAERDEEKKREIELIIQTKSHRPREKKERIIKSIEFPTQKEVLRKLGEMWRIMSAEEKKPYVDENRELMKNYQLLKKEYENSGRKAAWKEHLKQFEKQIPDPQPKKPIPSRMVITRAIISFLNEQPDIQQISLKLVRKRLEEKFEVSLASKKDLIEETVKMLGGYLAGSGEEIADKTKSSKKPQNINRKSLSILKESKGLKMKEEEEEMEKELAYEDEREEEEEEESRAFENSKKESYDDEAWSDDEEDDDVVQDPVILYEHPQFDEEDDEEMHEFLKAEWKAYSSKKQSHS